ncbi:MAG: glycosyltransferase family 61 protein [Janthinobacterium lividum]
MTEGLSFRGVPAPHTPLGPLFTTVGTRELPVINDTRHYVHVGTINRHYGHFLIGIVARLWKLPVYGRANLRLVFDEHYNVDDLFRVPYARKMFSALNLSPENFVQFPDGAVFDRIEVPALAFEENSHVHEVYGDLMSHIGRIICPEDAVEPDPKSLTYLSKERLTAGIWRFRNEAEVTTCLRKLGFTIVFPEQISLPDHIALWRRGGVFVAGSSSGLHTSIFVPERRILVLNNVPEMWTNQVLLDRVGHNKSTYVHPAEYLIHEGADDGFQNNYRVKNTETFAEEIYNHALQIRGE